MPLRVAERRHLAVESGPPRLYCRNIQVHAGSYWKDQQGCGAYQYLHRRDIDRRLTGDKPLRRFAGLLHVRHVAVHEQNGRRPVLADVGLRLARPGDHAGMFRRERPGRADRALLALLVGRSESSKELSVPAAIESHHDDQLGRFGARRDCSIMSIKVLAIG
jgi:hypothetical protein